MRLFFAFSYSNDAWLGMFSFGFEKVFSKPYDEVFSSRAGISLARAVPIETNVTPACFKSLESAKAVVMVLVDSLIPTGYICFAPDSA